MITLYRRLIALRRQEPALLYGRTQACAEQGCALAFTRTDGPDRFYVALNLGDEPLTLRLPADGVVVLSTRLDRDGEPCAATTKLRPNEGVVIRLA